MLTALRFHKVMPWLVLAASLAIVFVLWQNEKKRALSELHIRFDFRVQEITHQLQQQVVVYEQLLSGVQSLFAASEQVKRDEFQRYANTLHLLKNHPGIKALGFAPLVPLAYKETHLSAMREDGLPAYRIQPSGNREFYAPLIYLEPVTDNSRHALGYDAYSDTSRRRAMDLAAYTRRATISSKITFAQDAGGNASPAFVIYLPVYRPDIANETPEQWHAHLTGWISATFEVDALMRGIFGNEPNEVDIEIYDGEAITDAALMFDHDHSRHMAGDSGPQFKTVQHLDLLDHRWTLVFNSLPGFEAQLDQQQPRIVLLLGTGLSLLLTLLFWLLIHRTRSLKAIHKINQALTLSEQRWKFALEGAGDGVWDWDMQANEVLYSRSWKEMLGYTEEDIGSALEEWSERIHAEDATRVMNSLQAYCGGAASGYLIEHRLRCKHGEWKWILTRGMIVSRDQSGKPLRMVGTHTDISRLKESEELVWRQANFDTLTGLPNRRMFYDRLEQEIKKAHRSTTPLALIFLDLDRFKEINDTLGHDQGDLLLRQAAQRLLGCVRETDTVARLGGDEFILILNDAGNVEKIGQHILQQLAAPFRLGNEIAYMTASLGITLYPEDAQKPEDLLKNVDQAMYAAKNLGRNRRSYFTQSMQLASQARMQLANDLRVALAKQQFRTAYQPIVELATGKIFKAEALIRWQHPTRGLITPAAFIPVAEDTGLIVDIGDWIFREAAQQARIWRETRHIDFQISINKSPVQFRNDRGAHAPWYEYLQELELPGQSIAVEITESLLLDASENVSQILLEFRDAGIQVSLDDFGTGYSSLSYLKKFDIDYIKIDQAFVANLSPVSEDMALCEAIIVMAHKLGIKVIAEGIETEQQRGLLAEAGCDFGQGYLFSKPLTAEEFERLF
jgi:diguanylate cyclase (GGDEF)-like protein/PAS domain S-box-containing protein